MANILEITEQRPVVLVTEAGNTLQVLAPNAIVVTDQSPEITVTENIATVIVQHEGIQGAVGINWRGAWLAVNIYLPHDAVHYGGSCYFCTNGTGINPNPPSTDTDNWDLLVSNGAVGIVWLGNWRNNVNYGILDAIEHQGSSWICTQAHINEEPPTDNWRNTFYWDLIVSTAFIHKGDWQENTRYDFNETVLNNGQMWRSRVKLNDNTIPAHPYENTSVWEYVTTAWHNQGTYDSGTLYYRGEVVDHDGSSYLCIAQTNLSHDPPDDEWSLIASKGVQGIQGTEGIVWTGQWSTNPTYQIDEAVFYPITGKSYICIQSHLGLEHPPEYNAESDDYWDILAEKGDTGPASDEQGPAGGGVGVGYTFDLTNYSTGSNADGNCRFDVVALDLTVATKCWLSNKDNDGNDLSAYMLSFEDTTSAVKCYLNVAKKGEGGKFLNFTVSSITSNAGGWKELTLIEPTSYSAVSPFGVSELLNIGMNRTGDAGINWKSDWSSSTAYVLGDATEHNGVSWMCIQAHTNQEPSRFITSTYWDMISDSGTHYSASAIGGGFKFSTATSGTPADGVMYFNDTTIGTATEMVISQKDATANNTDVSPLLDWLSASAFSTTSRKMGLFRITSAEDSGRWISVDITSITQVSSTHFKYEITNATTEIAGATFNADEELVVSQARAGDPAVNLRGTYVGSTQYQLGDVVTYITNSWICTTATTSAPSSASANWNEFAVGMHYRQDWVDNITYYLNDVVKYSGTVYISVFNGNQTDQNPATQTAYWNVMVTKGDAGADGADGADGLATTGIVGTILMWAGHSLPDFGTNQTWGWCDGSVLNNPQVGGIGVYDALWNILGTTYGNGVATAFTLPNLQQRFPIGGADMDTPLLNGLGTYQTSATDSITLTSNHLPKTNVWLASVQTDTQTGTSTHPYIVTSNQVDDGDLTYPQNDMPHKHNIDTPANNNMVSEYSTGWQGGDPWGYTGTQFPHSFSIKPNFTTINYILKLRATEG